MLIAESRKERKPGFRPQPDRRACCRRTTRVPVAVRLGAGPWCDAGLTRDVSERGSLIELPGGLMGEYDAGDPIALEFRFPPSPGVWPKESTASVDGVIARTAADRRGGCVIGVRFVNRLKHQF